MARSPSSSYALGVLFLVIVSILWTACSMVVQHLYNDIGFDSPFLIVYIGTSLFSVFIPMRLGYERWGGRCCRGDGSGEGEVGGVVAIPWRNDTMATSRAREVGEYVEGLVQQSENDKVHDENEHGGNAVRRDALEMHSIPNNYHDQISPEDNGSDGHSFGNENSVRSYEPSHPPRTSSSVSNGSSNDANYLLSHADHVSMASKVAPLWFLSNYFYAMSLEWTTIASSTVLASMGSIFAFGFATCSRFGDERITKGKLMGVALCFLGGVATTWTDVGSEGSNGNDTGGGGAEDLRHLRYLRHPGSHAHFPRISDLDDDSPILILMGDLAGFFSAVGYGAYTVLIRHLCPKDEDRMSMQLLLGYTGLLNMILLSPVAVWVATSSSGESGDGDNNSESSSEWGSKSTDDVHATITWSIFLFLVLKGLLDNVLSDYLWARAVILTSATVASVGVGLTIPMAFVADWIMGNYTGMQAGQVWGAIFVSLGFLFVNINIFGEKDAEDESGVNAEEGGGMGSHSTHDVEILS